MCSVTCTLHHDAGEPAVFRRPDRCRPPVRNGRHKPFERKRKCHPRRHKPKCEQGIWALMFDLTFVTALRCRRPFGSVSGYASCCAPVPMLSLLPPNISISMLRKCDGTTVDSVERVSKKDNSFVQHHRHVLPKHRAFLSIQLLDDTTAEFAFYRSERLRVCSEGPGRNQVESRTLRYVFSGCRNGSSVLAFPRFTRRSCLRLPLTKCFGGSRLKACSFVESAGSSLR